jgi:hypothetical protein
MPGSSSGQETVGLGKYDYQAPSAWGGASVKDIAQMICIEFLLALPGRGQSSSTCWPKRNAAKIRDSKKDWAALEGVLAWLWT